MKESRIPRYQGLRTTCSDIPRNSPQPRATASYTITSARETPSCPITPTRAELARAEKERRDRSLQEYKERRFLEKKQLSARKEQEKQRRQQQCVERREGDRRVRQPTPTSIRRPPRAQQTPPPIRRPPQAQQTPPSIRRQPPTPCSHQAKTPRPVCSQGAIPKKPKKSPKLSIEPVQNVPKKPPEPYGCKPVRRLNPEELLEWNRKRQREAEIQAIAAKEAEAMDSIDWYTGEPPRRSPKKGKAVIRPARTPQQPSVARPVCLPETLSLPLPVNTPQKNSPVCSPRKLSVARQLRSPTKVPHIRRRPEVTPESISNRRKQWEDEKEQWIRNLEQRKAQRSAPTPCQGADPESIRRRDAQQKYTEWKTKIKAEGDTPYQLPYLATTRDLHAELFANPSPVQHPMPCVPPTPAPLRFMPPPAGGDFNMQPEDPYNMMEPLMDEECATVEVPFSQWDIPETAQPYTLHQSFPGPYSSPCASDMLSMTAPGEINYSSCPSSPGYAATPCPGVDHDHGYGMMPNRRTREPFNFDDEAAGMEYANVEVPFSQWDIPESSQPYTHHQSFPGPYSSPRASDMLSMTAPGEINYSSCPSSPGQAASPCPAVDHDHGYAMMSRSPSVSLCQQMSLLGNQSMRAASRQTSSAAIQRNRSYPYLGPQPSTSAAARLAQLELANMYDVPQVYDRNRANSSIGRQPSQYSAANRHSDTLPAGFDEEALLFDAPRILEELKKCRSQMQQSGQQPPCPQPPQLPWGEGSFLDRRLDDSMCPVDDSMSLDSPADQSFIEPPPQRSPLWSSTVCSTPKRRSPTQDDNEIQGEEAEDLRRARPDRHMVNWDELLDLTPPLAAPAAVSPSSQFYSAACPVQRPQQFVDASLHNQSHSFWEDSPNADDFFNIPEIAITSPGSRTPKMFMSPDRRLREYGPESPLFPDPVPYMPSLDPNRDLEMSPCNENFQISPVQSTSSERFLQLRNLFESPPCPGQSPGISTTRPPIYSRATTQVTPFGTSVQRLQAHSCRPSTSSEKFRQLRRLFESPSFSSGYMHAPRTSPKRLPLSQCQIARPSTTYERGDPDQRPTYPCNIEQNEGPNDDTSIEEANFRNYIDSEAEFESEEDEEEDPRTVIINCTGGCTQKVIIKGPAYILCQREDGQLPEFICGNRGAGIDDRCGGAQSFSGESSDDSSEAAECTYRRNTFRTPEASTPTHGYNTTPRGRTSNPCVTRQSPCRETPSPSTARTGNIDHIACLKAPDHKVSSKIRDLAKVFCSATTPPRHKQAPQYGDQIGFAPRAPRVTRSYQKEPRPRRLFNDQC